MDPFTLAYSALLQPARFAAYLDGGRRAIMRAALATLLWVGAALAFVGLILSQLIALGGEGIVAGLALAPVLALFAAGLAILPGAGARSVPVNVVFWLLRCQLAITPPLALLLALTFSNTLARLQQTTTLPLLLLVLLGVWAGGGLTVALVTHKRRSEAASVRWLLSAGAVVIAGLLWQSPVVRPAELLLLTPFCAGLTVGLLRPLSYFWEAPLSLGLALAARLGAPPLRLLALHPARYDDLCLLPLPGLSDLLARACVADLDAGGELVLRVADHCGQGHAAERAIRGIVRHGQLAHSLLFWLSTDAEGAALLQRMAERPRARGSLVAGYAALAAVLAPEAWPAAIARQREVFARAADLPGGQAMQALLEAGAGILDADRWPAARERLRIVPTPIGVEIDALWSGLERIKAWANVEHVDDTTNRAESARAFHSALRDMEGWPAALLAAVSEHASFLIAVEQRRGAWLA
jgi:hypothetical protein